jgi:hypothetical protein
MNVREWAEPIDLKWPLRRVIDHINGKDLLECGHPLPTIMAADRDPVFIYARRCPICHAASARDPKAEITARQQFLDRFARRPNRLDP